jgi:hypothetical protein
MSDQISITEEVVNVSVETGDIEVVSVGVQGPSGSTGTQGPQGDPATNLVTSVAGKQGAVTLAKGDVGLGSVDNTSDANKPVSTAQAAAIATKSTKGFAIAMAVAL